MNHINGFRKKNYLFAFPAGIPLKLVASIFLDSVIDSKYFLSDKGIAFVNDVYRLRKKYTQINGDVILCQKANQQSNLHGDFIDHSNLGNRDDVYVRIFKRQLPTIFKTIPKFVESDDYIYKYLKKSKTTVRYPKPTTSFKHNMIRRLTPRECFRLMGYCEDYKIVVSDQQAYKQSGNSIVVDTLIAILKSVDFESI